MDKNSLAHTQWECKYHIVFAPKYSVSEIMCYLKGKSSLMIFEGTMFIVKRICIEQTTLV